MQVKSAWTTPGPAKSAADGPELAGTKGGSLPSRSRLTSTSLRSRGPQATPSGRCRTPRERRGRGTPRRLRSAVQQRSQRSTYLAVLVAGSTTRRPGDLEGGVALGSIGRTATSRSPRPWLCQRRTLVVELAAIPFLTGDVVVTGFAIRHLARAVRLDPSVPKRPSFLNSRGSTQSVWHRVRNEGKGHGRSS
jgi:hypothetical protein